MRIGKLDRRVTLCRVAKTRVATGEIQETSTPFATVWAQRAPIRGTERWVTQQIAAEATDRFRIRWRPNISPIIEVRFEGKRYDVVEVLEVGRREGYDILASSRAEKTAVAR